MEKRKDVKKANGYTLGLTAKVSIKMKFFNNKITETFEIRKLQNHDTGSLPEYTDC